ncbi:hypothetical protein MTR67_041830 [Solanum verrucosum]|uniref:Terpene synthase metal-binding domain-containing protein n=1 Tax=Solanum verrucosum TaxID=315347 RepID=A0AAF0ULE4_SOLVR|nr:hypothetical protein MTR67_041830 [Solanum verrucosum]
MVDSSSGNIKRPLANFHSTVWGNYFLSYTPQLTKISTQEKIEFEELKEKVKKISWIIKFLRIHEEEILEEALIFTITHLKSMVPKLSNLLKAQVSEALSQPIHTNLPRLLARKYICIYEKIESHSELLLRFAKLDFNILQKLHQGELCELTRWWKNQDFAKQFPYARDRMVECYFWVAGVYFELQHSRARKMMTKLFTTCTSLLMTHMMLMQPMMNLWLSQMQSIDVMT